MVRYCTDQKFSLLQYINFLSSLVVLNKKYFLNTLKAAVKRNVVTAATSDQPYWKTAKLCHYETTEPILNNSGLK